MTALNDPHDSNEVEESEALDELSEPDTRSRLREAERLLRESEERFQALVTATGQIVWTTTPDGLVIDTPLWRSYTGQTVEQVRGWGWLDAVHPDDRARVEAVWKHAVATRTLYETEYRVRRADGVYRFFLVRGVPVLDASGAVREWVGFNTDITERIQFERRTQESLNALLALAESLVWVSSEPGPPDEWPQSEGAAARRLAELIRRVLNCLRVNIFRVDVSSGRSQPLAVVGLTAEEEERWWSEQQDSPPNPFPEVEESLMRGEAVVLDLTEPPYNARPNPYGNGTLLLAPMYLGGKLVGVIALDHGRARHTYHEDEIELARAVARLTALVIERERLLRERAQAQATELALRDANRRMDEFLSIASHELRTPLTTIKANVQLAHRRLSSIVDLPPDEMAARIAPLIALMARAERQATLLNRLVGDLLDVARIRSGKLELRLERCYLAAIVRDAVHEQRLNNPGRKIGLTAPNEPVPIHADADRIGQVVTNYLTNAIKYSREDRPIEVTLDVAGGQARVAVRDEGPGLPPRERKLVWDRFHRAPGVEVVTGSGVGLGLGLHISKTIIERHKGTVGVDSAVGHGSTFWFRLPLTG